MRTGVPESEAARTAAAVLAWGTEKPPERDPPPRRDEATEVFVTELVSSPEALRFFFFLFRDASFINDGWLSRVEYVLRMVSQSQRSWRNKTELMVTYFLSQYKSYQYIIVYLFSPLFQVLLGLKQFIGVSQRGLRWDLLRRFLFELSDHAAAHLRRELLGVVGVLRSLSGDEARTLQNAVVEVECDSVKELLVLLFLLIF
jgi:hypothetical protein